jgi:hypothetical protein
MIATKLEMVQQYMFCNINDFKSWNKKCFMFCLSRVSHSINSTNQIEWKLGAWHVYLMQTQEEKSCKTLINS